MSEADIGAAAPRHARHDLTRGPISRTLLLFALPTLGSNILQSINGSINSIWVARFLGQDALAATSNANLIMFLMFSTVFGFGMAATILVGQAVGRRDVGEARRVMASSLSMLALVTLPVAIAGWIWSPALLHTLGTPAPAYPFALDYLRVTFLGLVPGLCAVVLQMGLRGAGDSVTPLWFMCLSAAIDVTLNPLLIMGLGPFPRMGIAGSAMATLIANLVSFVGLLAYVQLKDHLVRIELRKLMPDPALARILVTKGLPMGLQLLVMSMASLVMIGLVNREGVVTTAAYGVTQQLWTYIQMPAIAIGSAVSAMAAQNIGAGRWDRLSRITRAGLVMNVLLTGVLVAALMLADRPALELFLPGNEEAIGIARHINNAVSWSFILMGASMVLSGIVRANGAVMAPLIILIISAIPVRIGVALLLLPQVGADAIWGSFALSSAVGLLLTAGYYRWGGWRAARMAAPIETADAEERCLAEGEPGGRMQPAG